MKRLATLIFLSMTSCVFAQPAPKPITVNSQSATVPALQVYQANAQTFRVTYRDGTNVVNLTGYIPAMSWATGATATAQSTSSWAFVGSATNGIVDFTFSPAALNTNGTMIYEVGVAGLPFVYRQGVFVISPSPMGSGAAALIMTNPAAYVASIALTQAVNGAITFAGAGVTQTGSVFNFSGGGGGGSGTLTGAVVAAGSSSRLTSTNDGSATVKLNFDAAGLATGTPVYVESDPVWGGVSNINATNVSARLASNVWDLSGSTTNYVARTGDTMTGDLLLTNVGANASSIAVYHTNASLIIQVDGTPVNPTVRFTRGTTNVFLGMSATNLMRATTGGLSPAYRIWDAGNDGSSSGLDADLLDGLDSLQILPTIATNGTGNAVTNLTFGGNIITQQLGTITGGSGGASVDPEILRFSRWEGNAAAWHVDTFPVGIDDVSVDGVTNQDAFAHFVYSTSLTTVTNKLFGRFTVPVTNHFPFKFRANQAGGVAVVSMFDGTAVATITQSLAAAATSYITNAPIPAGAVTNFAIEFRWLSTNAANPHRIGVGK